MQLGSLPALAILALLGPPALAAGPVTNCDRLASSPSDPKRVASGVEIDVMKVPDAETACRSALKTSPDVARFRYQLGRALQAAADYDGALSAYQEAMDKGYAAAADAAGVLFELGLGRDIDYRRAAELYQRALDAGDVYAANDLGSLHEDGNGFPKSPAAALALYRKAAEAGYPDAEVHIGYLYENGSGVAQSDSEAVAWYRKAADQGFALGQYDLALMYHDGTGVKQDLGEAIRLLGLAADQGDAGSILELARYARDGTGMAVDKEKAEQLFRKAIDSGDDDTVAQARNELAWMFAREGRNLDEAARLAEDAVAAQPNEGKDRSNALDTSAWIAHLRHDDAKALKLVEQAIKGDVSYAPYHDHRGDILLALGRQDDAATEWRRALDLEPPDPGDDWDRDAVVKKVGALAPARAADEPSPSDPNAPTISPAR